MKSRISNKILSEGRQKLTEEMNIVQLIKKVRNFETIIECSLLQQDQRKIQVEHAMRNIIDLDSDEGISHQKKVQDDIVENDIDFALQQQILFKDDFSNFATKEPTELVNRNTQAKRKKPAFDPKALKRFENKIDEQRIFDLKMNAFEALFDHMDE